MRWITHLFVSALLSLVVIGCVAATGEKVPFTVVEEGDTASDYPDQRGVVIDSLSEWKALWEQLHRYTIPQPALPEVDFTQLVLVAVFAGEKRSGGYTIQVQRVIETKQALTVHASVTAPEPDQVTTAQITYPYHIVKIPRTRLPVHFNF